MSHGWEFCQVRERGLTVPPPPHLLPFQSQAVPHLAPRVTSGLGCVGEQIEPFLLSMLHLPHL